MIRIPQLLLSSPDGYEDIYSEAIKVFKESKIANSNNPNGMGDAVLQLEKVSKSLSDNIFIDLGGCSFYFPKNC